MDNLDKYYFDRWAHKENWTDIGPTKKLRLSRLLMYIEKYFPAPKDISLIDYGCGSGWLFYYLNEFGIKKLYGWDIVPSVLEEVRKKYPYVRDLFSNNIGRFANVPVEKKFDLVTSIEVIEHVPYSGKNEYLIFINRLLKNDGFLFLTTPNGRYETTGMDNYEQQPVEDWNRPSEMTKILKSNGFKVIDAGSIYFEPHLSKIHKILLHKRIVKFLHKAGLERLYFQILDKTMFGLSTYFWCKKISD